jgi:predicted PurR-regulated permease PerM
MVLQFFNYLYFKKIELLMNNSKYSPHIALDLLAVISIVFIFYILKPIIVPLLFAIILSISMFPVVLFLERKWRFNRVISALTVILLLTILVILLFSFIGYEMTSIVSQGDAYVVRLNQLYSEMITTIEATFGIQKEDMLLKNVDFGTILKNNFSNILQFVTLSGGVLGDMVLIPLYMFFFLLYRRFFQIFIYKVFSKSGNHSKVKQVLAKLYDVQQNYLIGLLTVMLIVGVLNSVGLLLLGIDYAIFFGFLASFLLLIPYIGIIIGSLIPALLALVTKDSVWYSVGVIAIFAFVQFLEGNLITPKITGSKVSMNSFIAILSIIMFSMLWGTIGMILALPVTASLKVIFDSSARLRPYGFLIGEPLDEHLKSKAVIRLKKWQEIRAQKETI